MGRKITDTERINWLEKAPKPNGIRWYDGSFTGEVGWKTQRRGDGNVIFTRKHKSLRGAIDYMLRASRRKDRRKEGRKK